MPNLPHLYARAHMGDTTDTTARSFAFFSGATTADIAALCVAVWPYKSLLTRPRHRAKNPNKAGVVPLPGVACLLSHKVSLLGTAWFTWQRKARLTWRVNRFNAARNASNALLLLYLLSGTA